MLNAELILEAVGYLSDKPIAEAGAVLARRARRRALSRTLLLTAALALALSLLLAATAYALGLLPMSHRTPVPEDAPSYYFDGEPGTPNEGIHLDLNFGECALALHFDVPEAGPAHGFRLRPDAGIDPAWVPGGTTLLEALAVFDTDYAPADQRRTLPQALSEAGLTEEEAGGWYKSMIFTLGDGSDRLQLRVDLTDAPWLHGVDRIYGWPEGEAVVVREAEQGPYQLLEVLIDRVWSEDRHELTKHLYLFHPEQQFLLELTALDGALSFEQLEALAEKLDVLETGFSYSLGEPYMNWSVCDFGVG